MINKVILVGNVGKDPEVRYIDSNVPVARFPLATSERSYTGNNGTQVPERTEWHTIVVWRNLADVAEKYVRKGTQLYIEGKITYRQWNDKNNVTHYSTEIVADTMQLLGRRPEGQRPPLAPLGTDVPMVKGAQPQPQQPQAPLSEPSVDDLPPASQGDVNQMPF